MLFRQVGRHEFVNRDNPEQIDRDMAAKGWELAQKRLQGDFDLVILDEINVAMDYKLLKVDSVVAALRSKPAGITVKAGTMETADIIVVNKCDRDGADKTAAKRTFSLFESYKIFN